MKDRVCAPLPELRQQIIIRGKANDFRRPSRMRARRHLTFEDGNLMPCRAHRLRERQAELAGRGVGDSAHPVDRLVARAASDDDSHGENPRASVLEIERIIPDKSE